MEEVTKVEEENTTDVTDAVTGEVEVVIHPHDEDSQDDVINLGDSGMEAVTDIDDPGYEIVTEDKGTNCPSLYGSLKKDSNKDKNVDDKEIEVAEEAKEPQTTIKKWSKLMKYTLPSKNGDKSSKKNKERKSLKDKMKDNDLVAFLTERRAVSESRFRVLDNLADPPKTVTKTKSDQSLDETWNTGITSGIINHFDM